MDYDTKDMQDMPTYVVCGGNAHWGYIEVVTCENERKALEVAEKVHGSHNAVIYNLGHIDGDLYDFLCNKGAIEDGYGSFDYAEFMTYMESR